MLDHLKKSFGLTKQETPAVEAEAIVEATSEVVDGQAELVASLTAKLESSDLIIQELTAKLNVAEQTLSAIAAEKQALVQAALEEKMNARKELIINTVGTAKADALFAATEKLEDEQFNAIVDAMASNLDAEASSSKFQEQGVTASASPEAVEDKPVHFNKFIKK